MSGALSRADVLTQIRPPLAQFAINIRVWCAQLGNNQKSKIYLVHNIIIIHHKYSLYQKETTRDKVVVLCVTGNRANISTT